MLDRNGIPLIGYNVPLVTKNERCYALRWDADSVIKWYASIGLGTYGDGFDSMDKDQISKLVRKTFSLHNKPIDDKRVKQKIDNTSKFILSNKNKE